MEKKITLIRKEEYEHFVSVSCHCDKETAAKIIEFIAELDNQIHTLKTDTNDDKR